MKKGEGRTAKKNIFIKTGPRQQIEYDMLMLTRQVSGNVNPVRKTPFFAPFST